MIFARERVMAGSDIISPDPPPVPLHLFPHFPNLQWFYNVFRPCRIQRAKAPPGTRLTSIFDGYNDHQEFAICDIYSTRCLLLRWHNSN